MPLTWLCAQKVLSAEAVKLPERKEGGMLSVAEVDGAASTGTDTDTAVAVAMLAALTVDVAAEG